MYRKHVSSQFKTDLKGYKAHSEVVEESEKIIGLLVEGKSLTPKHKDHGLKGEFAGVRECHIFPDVLLIYEIDKKKNVLNLVRIGSHSEIFG